METAAEAKVRAQLGSLAGLAALAAGCGLLGGDPAPGSELPRSLSAPVDSSTAPAAATAAAATTRGGAPNPCPKLGESSEAASEPEIRQLAHLGIPGCWLPPQEPRGATGHRVCAGHFLTGLLRLGV